MAGEARKDFFISYNQADKAWAEWIAWELENAGYTIIIQAWDFRPGGNFVLDMQKAAASATRTIAVLSLDYLTSQFTQPEWAAAFAQDPTGAKGILVPVRVSKIDLEGLLGQIIYINLIGLDEEAARNALISGIEQRRAKPSSAPRFPGTARPKEGPRFPGSLPPIWNVPHQRNPNFTGREQLLKDLRESLISGQATALTQAALHGLGGIGKTQLALEYAYRHAPDYDLVWWVRSESSAALAADFAALAGPLDLPEKGAQEQEIAVAAVRQHLGQRGKWLLIFDNAGEPQDLKNYLPPGGGGHILITSRYAAWRGTAQPLEVQVWPRGEAVAFLLKRTGQEDEAAAGALFQELGDLPLALEQAAAYMEACGQSLSSYLQLFRERHQELLRQGRSSQDYPDTVATTWELSFQKVQDESPAAADLLNLCAFLAPDDIPRELLAQGVEHLPERLAQAVKDPLALNAALAALRRYSLMEVGEDALAVHRLVQAVVRDRLDNEGKKKWAGAAVEIVNLTFPGELRTNIEAWPWCDRILNHAFTTAGEALALRSAIPTVARLLNQVGFYLDNRAEFKAAKFVLERAMSIIETAYGRDHSLVAICANNLGNVLKNLGDLEGAKAQIERALAIDEAIYGYNHPQVATDLGNLGSLLQELGDLKGAKANLERSLTIYEEIYGLNHAKVALRLNNLGVLLSAMGNLEGAKVQLERAIAIDEEAYGPLHPEVARDLVNLSPVLMRLGDGQRAKVCSKKGLGILEKRLGPNHPNVAMAANTLGGVLYDLGDIKGAKGYFKRALKIWRQFLGDDHPYTKIAKKNLASLGLPANKR